MRSIIHCAIYTMGRPAKLQLLFMRDTCGKHAPWRYWMVKGADAE